MASERDGGPAMTPIQMLEFIRRGIERGNINDVSLAPKVSPWTVSCDLTTLSAEIDKTLAKARGESTP